MFERFTDHARKVMALARKEALRFNHDYIGTEHILLGMVREESGVSVTFLGTFGRDFSKISNEVEKRLKYGPSRFMPQMRTLPFNSQARRALKFSLIEAIDLHHNFISTEHILLGLLREKNGIVAKVLQDFGFKLEEVRKKAAETLAGKDFTNGLSLLNLEYPRYRLIDLLTLLMGIGGVCIPTLLGGFFGWWSMDVAKLLWFIGSLGALLTFSGIGLLYWLRNRRVNAADWTVTDIGE